MTQLFLKAKHWQLFLPLFGIPLILQFVMVGTMMASFGEGMNADPAAVFSYFKFFPFVMVIFAGVFFGWFWSVAMGLQYKVPENVKMKVKTFRILFFIPLAYMIFILTLMTVAFNGMQEGTMPEAIAIAGFMGIIFPLHLFSMFCIFYTLYFVAKTFKTVELQREVTFSDFAGEFFMIWFYPVGIWIIQPKINKMIAESTGVTR